MSGPLLFAAKFILFSSAYAVGLGAPSPAQLTCQLALNHHSEKMASYLEDENRPCYQCALDPNVLLLGYTHTTATALVNIHVRSETNTLNDFLAFKEAARESGVELISSLTSIRPAANQPQNLQITLVLRGSPKPVIAFIQNMPFPEYRLRSISLLENLSEISKEDIGFTHIDAQNELPLTLRNHADSTTLVSIPSTDQIFAVLSPGALDLLKGEYLSPQQIREHSPFNAVDLSQLGDSVTITKTEKGATLRLVSFETFQRYIAIRKKLRQDLSFLFPIEFSAAPAPELEPRNEPKEEATPLPTSSPIAQNASFHDDIETLLTMIESDASPDSITDISFWRRFTVALDPPDAALEAAHFIVTDEFHNWEHRRGAISHRLYLSVRKKLFAALQAEQNQSANRSSRLSPVWAAFSEEERTRLEQIVLLTPRARSIFESIREKEEVSAAIGILRDFLNGRANRTPLNNAAEPLYTQRSGPYRALFINARNSRFIVVDFMRRKDTYEDGLYSRSQQYFNEARKNFPDLPI